MMGVVQLRSTEERSGRKYFILILGDVVFLYIYVHTFDQ